MDRPQPRARRTHDPARDPILADRHGRRAGPRGDRDPRRRRLPRAPRGAGHAVHGHDQQLHLHAARPRGAPAGQRAGRPRGEHLDVRPGDGAVPAEAASGRLGVRHRRGRPDDRPARRRLHADRAGPGLRGHRRDPHLQLRARHARGATRRRRGPLHCHQPGSDRPDRRRAGAGHRCGHRAHQPCNRASSRTSSGSRTR